MTDNDPQSSAPRLALIGVAIIMVVAGLATSLITSRQVIDFRYATVLQPPMQLPDFELIDENGERFDLASFEGKWNLVFFGFTHCPDVCPTTLMQLKTARGKLQQDHDVSEPPRVVFVSVDPERDTPAIIAPYVRYFGDDVKGLTGDPGQIDILARSMGAFYQKVEMKNGDYAVDHSASIMVIDPAGRFRALFNAPFDAELFVRDLQLLLELDGD
jgi:protein SCO1/2